MTSIAAPTTRESAAALTPAAFVSESLRENRYARLGSLGEHLFASVMEARGCKVEAVHTLQTDFTVDGVRVDVKTTTRSWKSAPGVLKTWRGKRVRGVKYAQVELIPTGARVSLESDIVGELDWDAVQPLYQAWVKRIDTRRSGSALKSENARAWAEIKRDLEAFYESRGLTCRAIYRTNQKSWGKESPANLKLKNWPEHLVRVFVSFAGAVDRGAVEYVLAIGAGDAPALPMLREDEVSLHKAKVDLARLDERLRFSSLETLFSAAE